MREEIINYTVRLPRRLKDALRAQAGEESRSLNAHFVKIMERYIGGELVPVESLLADPGVRNLIKSILSDNGLAKPDVAPRRRKAR